MKINENGDFCLLYIEPADEKTSVFATIAEQTRPVVLFLPSGKTQLFQHPTDFSELKHLKRQTGLPIVFVCQKSERLAQMPARAGFPVYPSIDAIMETLAEGRRLDRPEPANIATGYVLSGGDNRRPSIARNPMRGARTGPLAPGAGYPQQARPSVPLQPLHPAPPPDLWPGLEYGSVPVASTRRISLPPSSHPSGPLRASPLASDVDALSVANPEEHAPSHLTQNPAIWKPTEFYTNNLETQHPDAPSSQDNARLPLHSQGSKPFWEHVGRASQPPITPFFGQITPFFGLNEQLLTSDIPDMDGEPDEQVYECLCSASSLSAGHQQSPERIRRYCQRTDFTTP
jgi:hypothetical protein